VFYSRTDRRNETTLRIVGSLDALSAPEFRVVMGALIQDRRSFVTVDLSALSSIDGSGIGALVSLWKRIGEQGGDVRSVGARDQPLAIFRLLRLESYFSPPASRAQANTA
jgi:anti-sigma B factor antagonist